MAGLNLGITGQGQTVSSLAIAPGGVSQVRGVNTAGYFGVGTTVAGGTETQLTTTSQTTVATFTPPATGLYDIKVYYRLTGTSNVNITVSWVDPGGARTETLVNLTSAAAGDYPVVVIPVCATSGGPITIQATAGTANAVYVTPAISGS